jgi:hypothetical protein
MHVCLFRRYKLPAEAAPKSAAAAAALAAIDVREPDAELRADLMANALLVPLLGKHSEAQPTAGGRSATHAEPWLGHCAVVQL